MMTAVEWLEEHMKKVNWIDRKLSERMDIIQQAKEMEKEQIVDAYTKGADDEYELHINPHLMKREDVDAEQYYNETFKPGEQ